MKNRKALIIVTLSLATTLFTFGFVQAAVSTVTLGTADSFAILAGTGITNIPNSKITGDVGLSPAAGSNYQGLTALEVSGTIYDINGTGPAGSINSPSLLTIAKNDLVTAFTDVAGRTPVTVVPPSSAVPRKFPVFMPQTLAPLKLQPELVL